MMKRGHEKHAKRFFISMFCKRGRRCGVVQGRCLITDLHSDLNKSNDLSGRLSRLPRINHRRVPDDRTCKLHDASYIVSRCARSLSFPSFQSDFPSSSSSIRHIKPKNNIFYCMNHNNYIDAKSVFLFRIVICKCVSCCTTVSDHGRQVNCIKIFYANGIFFRQSND